MQSVARRTILRDMYRSFSQFSFRATFVLGVEAEGDNPGRWDQLACAEQALHGDLSLIDMRENMNDGKSYYSLKFILDHVAVKNNFRCEEVVVLQLLDDSAYVYFLRFVILWRII